MLPEEFINNSRLLFNDEAETERFLASLSREEVYKGIRANTLKLSKSRLVDLLKKDRVFEGVKFAENPYCSDGVYFQTNDDEVVYIGESILWHLGLFYSQEPSASAVVEAVTIRPNDWVLDCCAAPGGKSTAIAEKLNGTGLLVSNEYVYSRAGILSSNLERHGVKNAVILSDDVTKIGTKTQDVFDKVFVDAPCSGEGMFRKTPISLSEWSNDNVRMCAARTTEILEGAALAVKRGGNLIFSTCTFNTVENEQTVVNLLMKHPDFELVSAEEKVVNETSNGIAKIEQSIPLELCRRVFPHANLGEGHFIAVLKRKGDKSDTHSIVKRPFDKIRYIDSVQSREVVKALNEVARFHCDGAMYQRDDSFWILPNELPDFSSLRVVRAGYSLVESVGKRHLPTRQFVMTLSESEMTNRVDIDEDIARRYLRGEEVDVDSTISGLAILTVLGYPLSLTKIVDGRAKNYYPKGLRTRT